jgi:hypothetical protein
MGKAPRILRLRQGEVAAVKESLAIVANPKADATERVESGPRLRRSPPDRSAARCRTSPRRPSPRLCGKAALISLMAYDDPAVGALAVRLASEGAGEVRLAALASPASRTGLVAGSLPAAVKEGRIPASTVPRDMVERMRLHESAPVRSLLACRTLSGKTLLRASRTSSLGSPNVEAKP